MSMESRGVAAVIGVGPVGRAVIGELLDGGHEVRAIARHRPVDLPPSVRVVSADVTDEAEAIQAVDGAAVVYHAASATYQRWPQLLPPLMSGILAGVHAAGAHLVYADNVDAYGPVDGPLTEDLPSRAPGPNGRVRAQLANQVMEAHAAGRLPATIGRAADYHGPWGRQSQAGERLFVPALSGEPAQLMGDPDQPHTLTYLGDFARALVTLGTHDQALGQIWHVPSAETLAFRQFVGLVFEATGHVERLQVMPSALLGMLAWVSPMLRAVREQHYQLERPFVVDHTKFARAFGAQTTPHPEAIRATVDWFRAANQTTPSVICRDTAANPARPSQPLPAGAATTTEWTSDRRNGLVL